MESSIIDHLKVFNSYRISQDPLKKLVADKGDISSKLYALEEKLKNAAKVGKAIRQLCGIGVGNEHASKDEGEASESFDELPLPEVPVEPSKERKKFRVLMDVHNFLPQNVNVKVDGKYLVVHAKQDFTVDEHGIISREFTRKFEIPEDVDIESFRSMFDVYKVLTVEASLKPKDDKVRNIDVVRATCGQTRLMSIGELHRGFQEFQRQMKD